MSYALGSRSLQTLEVVHPDLVAVVKLAITLTEQDFSVGEGIRSVERQRELLASGKTTTMNSIGYGNGSFVFSQGWMPPWARQKICFWTRITMIK